MNTQVSLLICRPDNGVLPPVNKLVSTVNEMLNSLFLMPTSSDMSAVVVYPDCCSHSSHDIYSW